MGAPVVNDYSHITLTPEETTEILRLGRKMKDAKLKAEEYAERLRQPVVYPKLTAEQLLAKVIANAQQNYSPFELDEYNSDLFEALSWYFTADLRFENSFTVGADDKGQPIFGKLDKGLVLYGPIGCGKTTILELFHRNSRQSFMIATCRMVVEDYNIQGPEGLLKYKSPHHTNSRDLYLGQTQLGIVFDDLGTEIEGSHFGKKLNVMQDILLSRYENPDTRGPMTHITTNITPKTIQEFYDARLRSRMREMFNWIEFDPASPDRRK